MLRRLSKKLSFGSKDEKPPSDDKADDKAGGKADNKAGGKGDVYLRGEFMSMDYDGSGVISTDDFCKLLLYLGVPSKERIKAFLREINHDRSSTITIDEYFQLMEKHPEVLKQTCRWRNLFLKFDLNRSGEAYREDILKGFREMGVEVDDEIKEKIKKLDKNGNGQVDYKDFLKAQLESKGIIPKCD